MPENLYLLFTSHVGLACMPVSFEYLKDASRSCLPSSPSAHFLMVSSSKPVLSPVHDCHASSPRAAFNSVNFLFASPPSSASFSSPHPLQPMYLNSFPY